MQGISSAGVPYGRKREGEWALWDAAIVIGYVAVLALSALLGGRKVQGGSDFTAAPKRYGSAVIFATLSASYVGGGYSSGNAAMAFSSGIGSTCTLLGFSLSMIAIARWLVPGVERFPGVTTVGGVLEAVYGRRARIVSGWLAFLCCAGVVGAQMETMGVVLHTLTGWPPALGIAVGAAVVLLYTTFGGLQSVIVADVVQFVLLAVGMPVLLIAAVRHGGGVQALVSALPAEYANPFNALSPAAFFSLFLAMSFGEALAPPYTQRLLVGRNARETARGTLWSGLFSIPFFAVTGAIGLAAYALGVTTEASCAMPALICAVLPTGLRGLVMAAMVSVLLSASDSFLNSAAVGLVSDGILPWVPLNERRQLFWLRIANVATGLTGVAMALWLPDVFSILLAAYSCWCPLLLVPLAAAFAGYTPPPAAFWRGLAAGGAVLILWNGVLRQPGGVDGGVMGMLANALVFLCHPLKKQPFPSGLPPAEE